MCIFVHSTGSDGPSDPFFSLQVRRSGLSGPLRQLCKASLPSPGPLSLQNKGQISKLRLNSICVRNNTTFCAFWSISLGQTTGLSPPLASEVTPPRVFRLARQTSRRPRNPSGGHNSGQNWRWELVNGSFCSGKLSCVRRYPRFFPFPVLFMRAACAQHFCAKYHFVAGRPLRWRDL